MGWRWMLCLCQACFARLGCSLSATAPHRDSCRLPQMSHVPHQCSMSPGHPNRQQGCVCMKRRGMRHHVHALMCVCVIHNIYKRMYIHPPPLFLFGMCIYICMYICICMYVCMYVCIYVCIHVCVYFAVVCIYICVPICLCIYAYTYVHTYMYVYMYIYV